MSRRHRAREVALQLLFQHDQNKPGVKRKVIERFAKDRLVTDPANVPWCLSLYDGVQAHLKAIDARITARSENWRINRMTAVDRNVLRLGAFELLHDPARPPIAVVIDEMIELARRFGSLGSPAFVNGILDALAGERAEAAVAAPPAGPT